MATKSFSKDGAGYRLKNPDPLILFFVSWYCYNCLKFYVKQFISLDLYFALLFTVCMHYIYF